MKDIVYETESMLSQHGKTFDDIKWFGYPNMYIRHATVLDYLFFLDSLKDNTAELNNLLIVGEDFWMKMKSESSFYWWDYKEIPVRPEKGLFFSFYRPEEDPRYKETCEPQNHKPSCSLPKHIRGKFYG